MNVCTVEALIATTLVIKLFFYYRTISYHYHIKSRLSKATTLYRFITWLLTRAIPEVAAYKKASTV